jgi:chorismate synthase
MLTAGESHGKCLVGILEGLPSGLELSSEDIDRDLKRRQGGHGRGGRMKIEADHAEILSGVRWGRTLGSPLTLRIENRDWQNWQEAMSPETRHEGSREPITRPRPGHADLPGAMKYGHRDIRNVLERSSARETAMRVGLGAVAKKFLDDFGIRIGSYITEIGPVSCSAGGNILERFTRAELGGVFEVFAVGVPPGLGSHVHWDRRLDGRLAQAVMSIQAIKSVEVGIGAEAGRRKGSEVMDEIGPESYQRYSNNAGGIEGGTSNGMPLLLRAAMKPIPTLKKPLRSVDISTKEQVEAIYERSDVCAAPAAAVIAEAMVAFVMADVLMEKFGGDSMDEIRRSYSSYMDFLKTF